jgi:hypothetical protein
MNMKQVWIDVANDMLALSEKGYAFRLTDTPDFSLGSCAEVSLFIYFKGDLILEAAIDLYAESGARYNMYLHRLSANDTETKDISLSLDKEVSTLLEYVGNVGEALKLAKMTYEEVEEDYIKGALSQWVRV